MSEFYTVTPRSAARLISEIIEAGLVPHLVSSPGMGKSSIISQVSDDFNLFPIDHRMSTSEPTDMNGLPRFIEDYAEFVPFRGIFPTDDRPIPKGKDGFCLILDEFMSMKREMQAGSYKLILDRMVGQKHLHPNTAIITASNMMTDRAIVNPMSTAMQSRLIHLEMVISHEEWLEDVAIAQKYDGRLIAFLSQYPSKLMDFKPDHEEKSFCCPRTWEFMNKLVKGKDVTDCRAPMYAGTITSGVAAEFIQFCKIYANKISVDRICQDPLTAPLPDSPSLSWATICHMLELADSKNFTHLAAYADRFTADFRILFYRTIRLRIPTLFNHPAFINGQIAIGKYIHG